MNLRDKKLVVFDLDGTLTESKSKLDGEMCLLLSSLLRKKQVVVISGGSITQFQKQFLSQFPEDTELFKSLFIFPASGTSFYRFEDDMWKEVHSEPLGSDEREKIISALKIAEEKSGVGESETYGAKIEDRKTQVTYSGFGQEAPVKKKKIWDPDQSKRKKMVEILEPLLPDYGIRIGGMTSVDVTRKGVDKAYGVRQMEKIIGVPISEMVFVGDALYVGGNDYPAKSTGVDCVEVKDIGETKSFIQKILDA